MNDNLFQYQSHLTHSASESKSISSTGVISNEQGPSLCIDSNSNLVRAGGDVLLSFGTQQQCPYCAAVLRFGEWSYNPPGPNSYLDLKWYGVQCLTCAWWLIQNWEKEDNDISGMFHDDLTTYEGIIGKFDPSIWSKPLGSVEEELSEYRKALSDLNPKEVEVLVGQLLSQYFNCDVRHVGRSRDQGIDLIVVKSDSSIAVQVKHRSLSGAKGSESVIPVREFVGAMVGGDFDAGIFVTTHKIFSSPAKEYAINVTRNWAPLNLVTARELQEFMGTVKSNQWEEFESIWKRAEVDRWETGRERWREKGGGYVREPWHRGTI